MGQHLALPPDSSSCAETLSPDRMPRWRTAQPPPWPGDATAAAVTDGAPMTGTPGESNHTGAGFGLCGVRAGRHGRRESSRRRMTERSLDVAQSPIEQQYGPVALLAQGAEARVWTGVRDGVPIVIKERFAKTYRHTDLDAKLTRRRTKTEVKCLARCAGLSNVKVPAVLGVDFACARIFLEFMQAPTVKTYINSLPADGTDARIRLAEKLGVAVAEMHSNNVVHGDLTSSNILVRDDGELVLIDFGLAYVSHLSEDKAVDLYVLERALLATHPDFTEFAVTLESYQAHAAESARVMTRFEKVRLRGRKRSMIG